MWYSYNDWSDNVQVGVTPVVKFDWDHKYYFGNLVAVHVSLNFVAYALKGYHSSWSLPERTLFNISSLVTLVLS